MLVSLHVKNLALIEETEVLFREGLNILTGETGAGKSIIMGSVNLALGGKADKGLIRTGADFALVELVFETDSEEQIEVLKDMDIPLEEDGTVIVMRKLMPERSLCKINGVTVSSRQLKELASLFIDIHGQNDTKELLNVKKYSQILDDYAGETVAHLKEELARLYAQYGKSKKELEAAALDEKEKSREISLASFEIKEIEEAALTAGEDIALEEQYRRMVNGKRIAENLSAAYECTGGSRGDGAGESISRAVRELRSVAALDSAVEELAEQLTEIDNLLNDFNRSLAGYQDSLEFEPEEFAQVEGRLNEYNRLKDKYGNTVEEILSYKEEKEKLLERLEDYEAYKQSLAVKVKQLETEILSLCETLSKLRKTAALSLQKELKQALLDLNFLSVELEIAVTERETFNGEGYNDVDFLISVNPGEALKSISKVASGGELSRMMLALKAVMADKEKIQTLIFDEIDAGISGQTAWKVSEKMAVLGRAHQLICITHLPQIAAMADAHFVIEKNADTGRSVTHISEIREEAVLHELARLLGGNQVTEAVLANARELKDLAIKTKAGQK